MWSYSVAPRGRLRRPSVSLGRPLSMARSAPEEPRTLVAEELRTPPVGLVALLGRADLHPAVSAHLHTEANLATVGVGAWEDAPRVIAVRARNRRIQPADGTRGGGWAAADDPSVASVGRRSPPRRESASGHGPLADGRPLPAVPFSPPAAGGVDTSRDGPRGATNLGGVPCDDEPSGAPPVGSTSEAGKAPRAAEISDEISDEMDGATRRSTSGASSQNGPGGGIMMRVRWLQKHRERRPAVAVAFVAHEDVEGDPSAWASLTKRLDAVRADAAGGSTKLVVCVAGDDVPGALPESLAGPLRRHAQVDPRALVTLPQPPTPAALTRLATTCRELADEYYVGECQRQAASAGSAPGLGAVKPGFKAAAFAEFRGDLDGAARLYGGAYRALLAVHVAAERCPGGYVVRTDMGSYGPLGLRPVQDRFERLAVAEQLHYKLCALALRGQNGGSGPGEAVEQMRAHMRAYKPPPPPTAGLPRAALPVHWAWVARQYHAFAELLAANVPWGGEGEEKDQGEGEGGGTTVPAGTPRTHLPGFYLQAAAAATEERRRASEAAADAVTDDAGEENSAPGEVADGHHVGTLRRVGAAPNAVRLSDAEYLRHVNESPQTGTQQQQRQNLTRAAIELLTKAREHFRRTVPGGDAGSFRLFASLDSQLASAHLHAGDFSSARQLFRSVAVVYRREGWDDVLWTTLMALKDCARHLSMRKEYLEICLELAALGAGLLETGTMHRDTSVDAEGAMAAALAAMAEHATAEHVTSDPSGSGDPSPPSLTPPSSLSGGEAPSAPSAPLAPSGRPGADALSADERARLSTSTVVVPTCQALTGTSGVARVVRCVAGFSAPHAVPGEPVRFAAALRSSLPARLEVRRVAVEFSDPTYAWRSDLDDAANAATNTRTTNQRRSPSDSLPASPGGELGVEASAAAASAAPEALCPGMWHGVSMCVIPVWGHAVEVTAVVVTLEAGITFRLVIGPTADATADESAPVHPASHAWSAAEHPVDHTERLPAAAAAVQLGLHALDLRGAPPRLSLEVSMNGPALLGEAFALPLAVVSTGDALAAARVVFRLREASQASSGGASLSPAVELLRDGGCGVGLVPMGRGEGIDVGDLAAGETWKGAVYVRWQRLGPPATLSVELRGRSSTHEASQVGGSGSRTPSDEVHTALETTAEISVQAPFTVTHATTSGYRQHALIVDGEGGGCLGAVASRDGTRVMSTVRVSAVSSRLCVASVQTRDLDGLSPVAASSNDADADGSVMCEGDEFLHVSGCDSVGGGEGGGGKALDLTWRRQPEDPGEGESQSPSRSTGDVHTVLPMVSTNSDAATSTVGAAPPPLTVSLNAPPHVATGVPFTWNVRCLNATAQPQALTVQVADAAGFVFAGSRKCSLSVAPYATADLSYQLVAIVSGEVLLPELVVTAPRFNAQLRPPRESRLLYVKPHAEPGV